MAKRYFVYILANRRRGVLYVGLTSQFINRLTAHKNKLVPGFTAKYGVVILVYFEEYASIVEARAREAALKRWRRDWKFALIEKSQSGVAGPDQRTCDLIQGNADLCVPDAVQHEVMHR